MRKELTPEEIEKHNVEQIKSYEIEMKSKACIIHYYTERLKQMTRDETVLSIMVDTVQEFNIDEADLADILQKDNTMLGALKMDGKDINLIGKREKHIELDIFN